MLTLRDARRGDGELIAAYIRELAEFEKLSQDCQADPALLEKYLFETVRAGCVLAEWDGAACGFALYFYNFSTFLSRPGLYIEDVFVRPAFRRKGIAHALFRHLAARAVAEGCGRMEWWVLDWNEDALRFYRALGAEPMTEWTVQRLTGDALAKLAAAECLL